MRPESENRRMEEYLRAAADHSALVLVKILQAYTPTTEEAANPAPDQP